MLKWIRSWKILKAFIPRSQPVPAIIDGFSLFYSLSDILLGRGVEHVFSYTSICNEIFRFMDYVTAKGIDIQCICRDTLVDYDKLDTYAERGENTNNSILKSWETDFKQRRIIRVIIQE